MKNIKTIKTIVRNVELDEYKTYSCSCTDQLIQELKEKKPHYMVYLVAGGFTIHDPIAFAENQEVMNRIFSKKESDKYLNMKNY